MRCTVDGCRNEAVCRFCRDHRPEWMPMDLERPSARSDDDTVDLRPAVEIEEEETHA